MEQIKENLLKVTEDIRMVDAGALASEAGNPRTENIVLLGAASQAEGFPLSWEQLLDVVKSIVPERTIPENVKAFELGVSSN